MGALLLLAALYLLMRQQPAQRIAPGAPATGQVTAGGATRISVPGFIDYTNVPGVGVNIALDPSFFNIAQPVQVPAPAYAQDPPLVLSAEASYPTYEGAAFEDFGGGLVAV